MKQFAKTAAAVLSVFAVTAFLLVFVSPMSAHAASDGGITMAQAQEILGLSSDEEPYVFEYTNSLTNAFNAIAAQEKGGILLISKTTNFTVSKFTTAVASDKTVIITSYYIGTYNGTTYDTDYRETVGAKLQFYTSSSSVTSFSWGLGMNAYIDCLDIVNGKSSINAPITIACNWNDLYIGKDVTCTASSATASQAFPAIVAGYDRDKYATGADFPAGETQNITVESGSWCYVAGGDMSTAELGTEEKPLREVAGNINITLNGGYYYGESDSALDVDRYGYNSHPSVLARCFAKYTETSNTKLVINGGEYQSAVFGYGITQHPTTAASNTTEQAGNLTIDFNGGKIACTRIRLDASTYAGTTDSLAGTTVTAYVYGGELTATDSKGNPVLYITANSLTEDNATLYWYDDGSTLATRLHNTNSKTGSYVKIQVPGVPAEFTLPVGVNADGTANGILSTVVVRDSSSDTTLDASAFTASENTITALVPPNLPAGSEYTVGIHGLDNISVYTFTYTDGAWECSEPAVDTEHKVEAYWVEGVFHYGCKKCAETTDDTLPTLKAALAVQSISAATGKVSGESTLRFIAKLELADGVTATKYGTYVALVALDADGKPTTAGAKVAVKEQTVVDGEPGAFALDLSGIPEDQKETSVYAWSYAELEGGVRIAVAFDAATVADALAAQQN